MSPRRSPAAPPDLPGFTYVDLLGSGGFADVYLYEQQLPRRRVAVKVLLTERMASGSVREFTDEANVMAMLSTHPAIVTIYQAGVAADGRPYLVMEYCPKPNLQVRYRREPFSVAESLRVGVQVAAAVETAHRAGVLHRDIKPANILVTEYNRPALTDFGIASTTNADTESAGLSIPWSPPESFADTPHSDVRSDVYALGATVYTLLAGRSPFELQGQRNTAADLIGRIETAPLPPLGRQDAPPSLQRTLERAMAKSPAGRHQSALEFARALQKVQIELSLAVTPIDILDDGSVDDVARDEDDGLTRVRGVVSIDPQTAPAAGLTHPADLPRAPASPFAPGGGSAGGGFGPGAVAAPREAFGAGAVPPRPPLPDAADETVVRAAVAPTAATAPDTIARISDQPAPAAASVPPPAAHRAVGLWAWIGAGVVVVALIVVGVVALPQLLGGPAPEKSASAAPPKPKDPLPATVPAPTDLAGTVEKGVVVWTWRNTDSEAGDAFLWRDVSRADEPGALQRVDEPTVRQKTDATGRTCIEVRTVRGDGASSDAVTRCVP
ncbi:serine/threonine-protein kinase [Microbacterium luticocti]|uniref:serine/threonine-protein kinase n=1 Tax=Microbacterium luticocti TaxID=451764 RepID=UPI00041F3F8A|nr:serine/threonine-protein kinase [Microbacterium luticocti]